MAGLLDYLFAPRQSSLLAPNTGMTSLEPPGYDPSARRRAALAQGLAGLGAGLLTGRNWSEGAGRGLLGFSEGSRRGAEDYQAGILADAQMAEYQRAQEQRTAQLAFAQKYAGMAGGGSPSFAGSGTVVTPGSAQYASAGGATPAGGNPMLAEYISAFPEQAGPMFASSLETAKPVTLAEGAMLIDPATGQPIAENTKPFEPKIIDRINGSQVEQGYYDQNLKWVPVGGGSRWQPQQPTGGGNVSLLTLQSPDATQMVTVKADDEAKIDQLLSQGWTKPSPAGMTVFDEAGNPVVTIGGTSGGNRSNTAKPLQDSLVKFNNVSKALDSYEQLVGKYGTEIAPGPAKTELSSAYQNVLLELKELFNLGVLNGPDYEIMQKIMTDPTQANVNTLWPGHNQGYASQIQLMRTKLDQARTAAMNIYGRGSGGQPEQPPAGTVPAPDQLKPGMVVDGYRYKGGDPAQQSAWEPVS